MIQAPPSGPPPAAVRRRRRILTGPLFSWAALLGVLAGAGIGYGIQASRAADPVPPLIGDSPEIRYAAPDVRPFVLPAEQDDKVRRDGDLRELLLPVPDGGIEYSAYHGGDNWLSLPEYLASVKNNISAMSQLFGDNWRRTAARSWVQPNRVLVNVTLHQFGDGAPSAGRWIESDLAYDQRSGASPGQDPAIPGTGSGRLTVFPRDTAPGNSAPYSARAAAWRGDIYMAVWFYAPSPIDEAQALETARQQAARL
ncbi:hypothetical protein [Yinghuangia sp. YIM S09857]|uniref:hypothetical protein n=1 Tax=Yinghuangia sp. YIM S09857 TaxID=3436929 RepID=UPI003F53AEDF